MSQEFYLYRVKFIKPTQLPLLFENRSAGDLFLAALQDKPELKVGNGEWHIGNVEFLSDLAGSFAIGRTTETTVERFDTDSGNFVDELDDAAPYTNVVFDARLGLVGIAKKTRLAPNSSTIARRIKDLLATTSTAANSGVDVRVDQIPDPLGFIEKLRGAYAIRKFKAMFTGPNPVDADELFQKPLSVYAQQMGAESGTLEVVGEALNEEVAEAVTKSTAATGNTASARIIAGANRKATTIRMKGDAVSVTLNDDATTSEVLERVQEEYTKVRE